ncbi:MAG TPA: TIGR01906 family membrane protein [Acidobacteriota bacterium]|nr:TIGR01906 family membrane protein [Acidobacteriota bacterium]
MAKSNWRLIVALSITILCASAFFTIFTDSVYERFYYDGQVSRNLNLNELAVLPLVDEIQSYLLGYATLNQTFYSEQAISHMDDVRSLFRTGFLLFAVSLATTLWLIIKTFRQKDYDLLLDSVRKAAASVILFCIAFILAALFLFEKMFILFHKIFFTNDAWLFNPNDTLVLLFPEPFFVMVFEQILMTAIVACAVLVGLSFVVQNRRQQRRKKVS